MSREQRRGVESRGADRPDQAHDSTRGTCQFDLSQIHGCSSGERSRGGEELRRMSQYSWQLSCLQRVSQVSNSTLVHSLIVEDIVIDREYFNF